MKILGSDYDGTLCPKQISEDCIAQIARWRSMGHRFGIVSGRGVDFPKKLAQLYPMLRVDFFALCNGAYIVDGEGRSISSTACREVDLRALLSDLFSWGCEFVLIHSEGGYRCVVSRAEKRPEWVVAEDTCLLEELPFVDSFYQLSVMFARGEVASERALDVRERYGRWLNPLQNGAFLDIVPFGVNKATGMSAVMRHYGGREEDVIVVGDNTNDMDMIRAFRSYAMADGVEALKQTATGVVANVTELLLREMMSEEQ